VSWLEWVRLVDPKPDSINCYGGFPLGVTESSIQTRRQLTEELFAFSWHMETRLAALKPGAVDRAKTESQSDTSMDE
jgi:hypothetical protein